MPNADPMSPIANLGAFRSLEDAQRAGYRLVKARDEDRYYLAQERDLQPLLVRLGDIAEVRFGIKTGANEFFYLEPMEVRVADILAGRAGATVRVRNSAGWQGEIEREFLAPVISTLKEVRSVQAAAEEVRHLLFICQMGLQELIASSKYRAIEYIRWGEARGYHLRSTCKNRQPWWNLGSHQTPDILFSRRLGDRHTVPFNSCRAYVSDTLYEIYTHFAHETAAILCSIPARLLLETEGRELTGSITVVELYIPDLLRTIIPNPAALTASQRERLLEAFNKLAEREVKSIFEELGLPKPNRDYSNIHPEAVSLERVLPDRRALDKVVFEVLGLSAAEQLAVYRAVVELVKSRLVKAQSVG